MLIPIADLNRPELNVQRAPDRSADSRAERPVHRRNAAGDRVRAERRLCAGFVPDGRRQRDGHGAGADRTMPERAGLRRQIGDDSVAYRLCAYARRALCVLATGKGESRIRAFRRRAASLCFDGIADPANLGAIFRSAAALGMDAVLLTPSCADPLYRRAVRVSMGAVFQIPWARMGTEWMNFLRRGHSGLRQWR